MERTNDKFRKSTQEISRTLTVVCTNTLNYTHADIRTNVHTHVHTQTHALTYTLM